MIIPVIMCGGAGTRLWPLSRDHRPKPLLPLLAVLAAGIATPLKRALRRRRFLPAAAIAAAMAALNFILLVDPEPRRLESEHAAVARLHRGEFRIEDNEPGVRAVIDLPAA